jgi:hypothetical protein
LIVGELMVERPRKWELTADAADSPKDLGTTKMEGGLLEPLIHTH